MTTRIKRATITIDDVVYDLFNGNRRLLDTLEVLQIKLQDKGDDPRYGRVIFAVSSKEEFLEVTEGGIYLAGVFPRVSITPYRYGKDNLGLRNTFSHNIRNTLVVVDNEGMAKMWEEELTKLEYPTQRL